MTVALLSLIPLRASWRTMTLKDFSAADLGGQESPQLTWGPAHQRPAPALHRSPDCLSFKRCREGPALLWTEGA